MSKPRDRRQKGDSGRMAGGFAAMPWAVLDCPAFARLSHPARALLLEMARQFVRNNNGRLLCSMAYLRERGWKSADVVHRAKSELLAGGFIHETCKGHRPNKASWYAVTWQALDRLPGYDDGTAESFRRGAFMAGEPLPPPKPTREDLYARWRKNAPFSPSHGIGAAPIAPSPGIGEAPPVPSHGTMTATFGPRSIPSHGNHLEMPSAGRVVCALASQRQAHETIAQLWKAIGGNPAKLWHIGATGPASGMGATLHCPT